MIKVFGLGCGLSEIIFNQNRARANRRNRRKSTPQIRPKTVCD